ncbi:MAG TPA: type II secretion system F family protein [Candidatus Acidoferrales bacterium]|nr:type II secretion system F family protein [Candidatus Acidoferrales bacterium]
MSNYLYEAVDTRGLRSRGSLDVIDQSEALRRIKEMGLFPTMVRPVAPIRQRSMPVRKTRPWSWELTAGRVRPAALTVFTRQLATLVNVGMPLLRGLRLLQEQEGSRPLKRVIAQIARTVEGGGTMSEALAAQPKVFNSLYVNMVRAGELGGVLEEVLRRQADFMEKTIRIKARIKAAMFYPASVLVVAAGIIALLLLFVIPRFQSVFEGLLPGKSMPSFTVAVMKISELCKEHFLAVGAVLLGLLVAFEYFIHTRYGRQWFDYFKLRVPVIGQVCRKLSLARFTRTLGTLLGSGVPILQALTIVKETAGNVAVGAMISNIHENVKEGGTLADPFRASKLFPAMVGGMVDVGEQTGALPDMLLRIADTSDEEVDNAVTALTSLLEPVMIIFLAVVVGSIVIAMFLPLIYLINDPNLGGTGRE